MKGLYIHPPKLPVEKRQEWIDLYSGYLIMPMGVVGLVNLLKESGIEMRGLNYPLQVLLDEDFRFDRWVEANSDARFILMDLHWYEHSYGVMALAQKCKKILPDVPVITGGFTASIFAEEVLNNFPQIDYIIRGDAEQPLLKLINQIRDKNFQLRKIPNLIYREGDHVVENECSCGVSPDDLDRLDFVTVDFLDNFHQYLEFQSTEPPHLRGHWLCIGRGCTYDCCHCGGGKNAHRMISGRNKTVLRSLESVVKDIKRLEERGIDQVCLSHDPSCLSQQYWNRLFELMEEAHTKIGLYIEFFQIPSRRFLEKFAEVAILPLSQLVFSPLCSSEEVRRINGKFFSNKQFFDRLSMCKELSVPIFIYFSLNLPLMNEDTFAETVKMAEEIYDFYPLHLLKMTALCHNLDPWSPMQLAPDRYRVNIQFKSFKDYYNYCQLPPFINSNKEVKAKRGYAYSSGSKISLYKICQRWKEFCQTKDLNCTAFH